MKYIADIVIYLVILIACLGAGQSALRLCGFKEESKWERFSLGAGAGLGILMLAVFAAGAAGVLYRNVIIAIIAVMFLSAPRTALSSMAGAFSGLAGFLRKEDNQFRVPAAVILLLFLLLLPFAFTPPVMSDLLAYQLAAPKIYAAHHAIIFLPDNIRAAMPSGPGMLYTAGLLLRGHALAQLFHLAFMPLCALVLYSTGRRCLSRKSCVWGAFLFCILYNVTAVAPHAMSDLPLAFFSLCAFNIIMRSAAGGLGAPALAGIFCGLAFTTKYQAAVVIFAMAVMMLVNGRKDSIALPAILARIVLMGTISLVVVSPWLVKNFIYTSNPFFPLFNNFFGGHFFNSADANNTLAGYITPLPPAARLLKIIHLPWISTMRGFSTDIGWAPPLSPIFLAFLPGLFFFRPLPRFVKTLAVFSITMIFIHYALWLTVVRYYLTFLALLCLVIGYTLAESGKRFRPVQTVMGLQVLVLTAFIFASVLAGGDSLKTQLSVLTGRTPTDVYISSKVESYRAMTDANKMTPPGAVILLGPCINNAGYYLDRDYSSAHMWTQSSLDWTVTRTPGILLEWMRDRGVTHVIYRETETGNDVWRGFVEYMPEQSAAWAAFIAEHTRPIGGSDIIILAEVLY